MRSGRSRAKAVLARRALQPAWERLHRLSLAGLNIGNDLPPASSGEAWVLRNLRALVSAPTQPLVIFDVGANVGSYAKQALTLVRGDLLIHCFEPSFVTFERLSANLGVIGGVSLYPFGLGSDQAEVPLFTNEPASGLASVYKRNLGHLGIELESSEMIQLRRLDDVCHERGIGRIDLLKLDVEGSELNVLRGAHRMLTERRVAAIQFEFGGCDIDSRTFLRDFYSLLADFTFYRIVVDGIFRVSSYGEHLERFLLTNFLAIAKRN